VTPGYERDFSVTDHFQSLQWRQSIGEYDELLLNLSHNRFYHGDKGFQIDDALPGVLLKVDDQIEEDRYEAELQYTRGFSDRWRGVGGVGYYRDRLRSPFYLNQEDWEAIDVFRLFGHVEYRPWDNTVINAGAMLERSELSRDGLFLPRLSVNPHFNDDHTVRLVYSTGSRPPTVYENQGRAVIRGVNVPLTVYRVYATGIDHGGLNPEINRLFEIGYLWRPSPRMSVDLRLFQENITDLIRGFYRQAPELLTALPDHRVLDFSNDPSVTIRGFEAQLEGSVGPKTRLYASYAFTDIDGDDIDDTDSAPQQGFSLLLDQALANGWRMSLHYDDQSAMTWYLETPIEDDHILDVRLARWFKLGNVRLTGEIVGTNLLGPVSDYLPYREWDRSVFVRLSADY
jgi:iron complex outermembrane receptor protein